MTELKIRYQKKSHTITDFYQSYIKDIELGSSYDVDFETYQKIVYDYFKFIRDQILDGKEFYLPYRLGTIQIIKSKPKTYTSKSLRYDWKAMKELGKPVYYLNEHSNGRKYRYYWRKQDCLFTNKTKYMFIASRDNKRTLAKIIINKEHDYVEI